ncbi:CocE/NonD family hydrolase [Planobispora takensis]|uniref:Peptidase S15 n=1 Tax=Planobispora takensis TaxID=1367882 RepID=A0A8J3WV48_9ACTN|nr:CocE/NonD family hydrolase [Planobispora takensis]GII03431.1 peptidase S15 [Planobispora takensis]
MAIAWPRTAHRVTVQRDLPVPMPDGVALMADRYAPVGVERPPAILVRSPYGRRGVFGLMYGRAFARQGFQVIMQSCRGGFGSGGLLDPLADEHADGLATLSWLREQPWYGGSLAMQGPSYLGYTQWALAPFAGPELKAMATSVTASQFRDAAYVGGAFALESSLIWTTLTASMGSPLGGAGALLAPRRTRRAALSGRPLAELDVLSAGRGMPFFQDLLAHHAEPAAYWGRRDFSGSVGEVGAEVTMVGGWYDVFLPWQIKDYAAMRAAGRRPYLTIGPWYHADMRQARAAAADALTWFRAHLMDDPSGVREQPVRLYVTGAGQWRDYPDWPVPGVREQRWHLRPGFGLAPDNPVESEPDRYRYDPAHPTPALGGPVLLGNSEPRDNRRLEARRDVLVYTGPELRRDTDMIGPVRAEIYLRSTSPHADVVVRVCDVHPDGTSYNVCEGVRRLTPGVSVAGADGVRRVEVDLWPIGHRFRRGHRVRVHVAGGAYPRIARNLGTGDPLGTGSAMIATDHEVFHDPDRPSAVVLPVVPH